MRGEMLRIVVVAGLCGAALAAAFSGDQLIGIALAALAVIEARKAGD